MSILVNSNFWGDVEDKLMTLAVTNNEIVDQGLIYISDNIQKKRAIPRVKMTNIIQPLAATPVPFGDFTEDERILDPDPWMVYVEFDPNDLRDIWEPFAPKGDFVFTELPPSVQSDLLMVLIEGKNGVSEYLGTAILQGDKVSGVAPYNRFNGIVTKALADADVIDVAGYAPLDVSNIFAKFQATHDASRVATRRNSGFKYLISEPTSQLYSQAQKNQSFKGVDVTSEGIMKFNGKPVVPLVGMPDNCIIATLATSDRSSNIWLGAQKWKDQKTIKVAPLQNNSDLWFFKMKMTADTQIVWGEDFTLYHA